jgi:hypothetical protein
MEPNTIDMAILKEWVVNAVANDTRIYHLGYGATDTKYSSEISAYIYKQATKGVVYLVRRRCPQDKRLFEYIAVKASGSPAYRLIPLPQDKLEVMYRMTKGAKNVKIRLYRASETQH